MKEPLITLATAKLAKEVGFDGEVKQCYVEYLKTHKSDNPSFRTKKGDVEMEHIYFVNNDHSDLYNENYTCYAAPTQSLLQKWLREKHNIFIQITHHYGDTHKGEDAGLAFHYEIYKLGDSSSEFLDSFYTLTYEEAIEDGLQESLKQIKSWKKKTLSPETN